MILMASQITSLTIVCSIVYSGADQSKHQSSASLAFVRGIHRGPVNSPHKWPVPPKMFPFDDVIMCRVTSLAQGQSHSFPCWTGETLKLMDQPGKVTKSTTWQNCVHISLVKAKYHNKTACTFHWIEAKMHKKLQATFLLDRGKNHNKTACTLYWIEAKKDTNCVHILLNRAPKAPQTACTFYWIEAKKHKKYAWRDWDENPQQNCAHALLDGGSLYHVTTNNPVERHGADIIVSTWVYSNSLWPSAWWRHQMEIFSA